MKSFFHFFAERNLLAYLITLLVILLGLSSLTTIKRDTFPDVKFGEILITTTYPGASPEDVELQVTNKIEKEIKKVTGIKRFLSWSKENVSTIYLQIEPDVDEDKVIREIRDAVSRVTDLPPEVTDSPLVSELDTSVFPIVEIGLAGDYPYKELREIARRFEKKLENVAGVSKVVRYGYRAREVRVEVSPDALRDKDISLADVVMAIKGRNVRATGGHFESYTSEKNIVTLAQFRQPEEVGDVIVRASFEGPLIKVKDLAIIKNDFEDERVRSRINGEAAISFIAHKASNADIIRTVDAIKKLVEKEKQYLPKGVKVLLSNDRSTYVSKRFSIVLTNGVIGLILVMLVLTIFLSFRVAFWVALGIPIAILGTIFLLPMFDSFLDTVTMTAMVLVIGIIVDDAIIIAEHIYQRYEQGATSVDAAVEGITGVIKPVFTTILTTLVVFAPLFYMPGILGKFVFVIPLVITLALIVSLIESTLALPAHLAVGLHRNNHQGATSFSQRSFHALRAIYRRMIDVLLRFRYVLVLGFFLVLGGALTYAFNFMDFVLFPSSAAERFIVRIETPAGSSLQATSDRTMEVEKIISRLDKKELESYVTRIGTFGGIGSSERENNAAVHVNLTPFSSRHRTADEIVASLRKKTDELKDFERIHYIIDAGGPPVGRPIMMRVVGADDAMRKKLAGDIATFLEAIEGTKDIARDDKPGKHQLEIKFDYAKLARVGISVADVAQNVRIAYDGEVVTSVRYGDEDVDFRVIFNAEVRKSPDYLKRLSLPNKSGHLTPLNQLAYFETTEGPANISHYKGDRSIAVSGDIDKDITTPLKVSQAVQEHFDIERDYPGMRLDVGGEAHESEKSLKELLAIFGIAIIGVYFLLILLFNSLWQPILVMMAVPFGIIGVIIGFAVHDQALGFLAMTGIVGLTGVVVNDSLVLVNHVNELHQRDPSKSLREIVTQGATDRLRAILLTTISTVVGLMPLAYGVGGADPFMSPMALALAWGLLFSTPLTLALLPCLYLIGNDIGNLFRKEKVA